MRNGRLARLARAAIAGAALAAPAAHAEGWGWGGGLFFAAMEDEAYAANLTTDDLFDAGGGIDFHGRYDWSPVVSQTIGFNTVGFDGEPAGDAALSVKTDAVRAWALYTGLSIRSSDWKGLGFFGRFEAGLSILDDVKHSVTRGGVNQGVETALDGGTDLYFGYGFGVSYGFAERWALTLGFTWRHYGTLEGNVAPGRLLSVGDVDVATGGVAFGVSYAF